MSSRFFSRNSSTVKPPSMAFSTISASNVFETHIHADHVSGNMELKSRTGADIYFAKDTPVCFEHKEVEVKILS